MRPFAIVVEPDGFCDHMVDAARGYNVTLRKIKEVVASYFLEGKFTIIFDLDGTPPRVLPNKEKGKVPK
jgi:hypothetical protein